MTDNIYRIGDLIQYIPNYTTHKRLWGVIGIVRGIGGDCIYIIIFDSSSNTHRIMLEPLITDIDFSRFIKL